MQLTPALGFIDILRGAEEGGIVSYSKDLQYNFDLFLTPGVFVLSRPIYDKTFEFRTI